MIGLLRITVPPGVVGAPELVLPTVGVDAPPAAIVGGRGARSGALSAPPPLSSLLSVDSQFQISRLR